MKNNTSCKTQTQFSPEKFQDNQPLNLKNHNQSQSSLTSNVSFPRSSSCLANLDLAREQTKRLIAQGIQGFDDYLQKQISRLNQTTLLYRQNNRIDQQQQQQQQATTTSFNSNGQRQNMHIELQSLEQQRLKRKVIRSQSKEIDEKSSSKSSSPKKLKVLTNQLIEQRKENSTLWEQLNYYKMESQSTQANLENLKGQFQLKEIEMNEKFEILIELNDHLKKQLEEFKKINESKSTIEREKFKTYSPFIKQNSTPPKTKKSQEKYNKSAISAQKNTLVKPNIQQFSSQSTQTDVDPTSKQQIQLLTKKIEKLEQTKSQLKDMLNNAQQYILQSEEKEKQSKIRNDHLQLYFNELCKQALLNENQTIEQKFDQLSKIIQKFQQMQDAKENSQIKVQQLIQQSISSSSDEEEEQKQNIDKLGNIQKQLKDLQKLSTIISTNQVVFETVEDISNFVSTVEQINSQNKSFVTHKNRKYEKITKSINLIWHDLSEITIIDKFSLKQESEEEIKLLKQQSEKLQKAQEELINKLKQMKQLPVDKVGKEKIKTEQLLKDKNLEVEKLLGIIDKLNKENQLKIKESAQLLSNFTKVQLELKSIKLKNEELKKEKEKIKKELEDISKFKQKKTNLLLKQQDENSFKLNESNYEVKIQELNNQIEEQNNKINTFVQESEIYKLGLSDQQNQLNQLQEDKKKILIELDSTIKQLREQIQKNKELKLVFELKKEEYSNDIEKKQSQIKIYCQMIEKLKQASPTKKTVRFQEPEVGSKSSEKKQEIYDEIKEENEVLKQDIKDQNKIISELMNQLKEEKLKTQQLEEEIKKGNIGEKNQKVQKNLDQLILSNQQLEQLCLQISEENDLLKFQNKQYLNQINQSIVVSEQNNSLLMILRCPSCSLSSLVFLCNKFIFQKKNQWHIQNFQKIKTKFNCKLFLFSRNALLIKNFFEQSFNLSLDILDEELKIYSIGDILFLIKKIQFAQNFEKKELEKEQLSHFFVQFAIDQQISLIYLIDEDGQQDLKFTNQILKSSQINILNNISMICFGQSKLRNIFEFKEIKWRNLEENFQYQDITKTEEFEYDDQQFIGNMRQYIQQKLHQYFEFPMESQIDLIISQNNQQSYNLRISLMNENQTLKLKSRFLQLIMNNNTLNSQIIYKKEKFKIKINPTSKIQFIKKKEISQINHLIILQIKLIGDVNEKYYFAIQELRLRNSKLIKEKIDESGVQLVYEKK